MTLNNTSPSWGFSRLLLQWLNLRAEESERTLLMFAVYTTTSIGLVWLEASTVALFLDQLGAEWLPWIYIASAGLGGALGLLSTWMQRILPLRQFIVTIAVLLAFPLLLFRVGLQFPDFGWLTVFLLPLWVDGAYALNHLNTSLTANQLFNIREIKRTFPLISSGSLVADVLSGFSLPLLLSVVGLHNIILVAAVMLVMGAGILYYLSNRYEQSFPDSHPSNLRDYHDGSSTRKLAGPLRQYEILLYAFFVIAQVLLLLIDFQYLSQLELHLDGKDIASFLGLFSGIVGICELITQWFISSRVIERMGVFVTAMLPPAVMAILGLIPLTILILAVLRVFSLKGLELFIGLIVLKFVDELLRYTFVASTGSVLFQPIPENLRGSVETKARGIAEPVATGFTGSAILAILWLIHWAFPTLGEKVQKEWLGWIVVLGIVIFALAWLMSVWLLRSRYVDLLVLSAQRGQLGSADVDLRVLKRAVVEVLERPAEEAEKRSCIELLSQIYSQDVGEILAPLLPQFPPALQRQSLEVMLNNPNPAYLTNIRALIETSDPEPDVLAVALRYVWLTEPEPDLRQLRPYLRPEIDPMVRGTAASLLLRLGSATQKAEATSVLRRMLTHQEEQERVMGCRALGEAVYLQTLRLQIPNLLRDKSLRVRCALLEAIAATRLEEYYPSLLRGLEYKSTREAALHAIVRLENDAIPMLLSLATNIHKPDLVRRYAWDAIGRIGTREALNVLVSNLMTAWGNTRRQIIQIVLKLPNEIGIESVLDRLGRSGVEMLIDQELMFMAQMYAARIDLSRELKSNEADLLQRALKDALADSVERCFLLMKFLYPLGAIQAAAFNLRSDSPSEMARGLEILDQTIDIPTKRVLLTVLDRNSDWEKLQSLAALVVYQPLDERDRVRRLLSLRHFLSDWSLACCFHLARSARWNLTAEATIACLRHPTGFVREAVIAYLRVASQRALAELLPKLKQDPDRLVAAQVQEMMAELGIEQGENPA
ncbi:MULTISPECIES: Npt1/Npt2 family nucleotide transporter [Aerosakkonema]|uniref:Npt1/Npt2 family nucleotide transporter n=1 Tax=Aerosakkonema TaxID=1246629 RepID=UPI0035BB7FDA